MLVGKILDIFGFDVDGAPLFLTLNERGWISWLLEN